MLRDFANSSHARQTKLPGEVQIVMRHGNVRYTYLWCSDSVGIMVVIVSKFMNKEHYFCTSKCHSVVDNYVRFDKCRSDSVHL